MQGITLDYMKDSNRCKVTRVNKASRFWMLELTPQINFEILVRMGSTSSDLRAFLS